MADSRHLIDKLWAYCDVLRDDGVGVIEYTEQLTYLLFLKMAHERANRKLNPQRIVPEEYDWTRLTDASGRPGDAVHMDARQPGEATGGGGNDIPKGAEQNPGPGEAQTPGVRPDRQGTLVKFWHRLDG